MSETMENVTVNTSAEKVGETKGIDGIIYQDKLGFDVIYIQARVYYMGS